MVAKDPLGSVAEGWITFRASDRAGTRWLLDRIIQYGFLTFGELRDTISRNQLKLPDVSEPDDFLKGDPLIRVDDELLSARVRLLEAGVKELELRREAVYATDPLK